jgi:hypothetical protein
MLSLATLAQSYTNGDERATSPPRRSSPNRVKMMKFTNIIRILGASVKQKA